MERTRVTSSATSPRQGSSSDSSMPLWPQRRNFQGQASTLELAWVQSVRTSPRLTASTSSPRRNSATFCARASRPS